MTFSHSSALTPRSDEVDRIIDSWSLQRPDIDTSPMEVMSRVSRLARILDLFRREAFSDQGLEPWEFDVLATLRKTGSPFALTPGALMAELLVSSGTMTNRIDRLEAKGLVERSRTTADRRTVTVTLTEKGLQSVDDALQTLISCEHNMLAPLPEDQRQQLAALLRNILGPLEEQK